MAEYIERESVLEIIRKQSVGTYRGVPSYPDEISRMFREVSKIHAADVAPVVRGRWEDVRESIVILRETGFPMTTTAETCTACRFRTCFVGPKCLLHDSTCPNCGAKMEG